MKYYDNMIQLVGNTPLVKLNKVLSNNDNLVLAKLEQFNPCSSLKDRTAMGMVNAAVESGILKENGTIIEATSGNTGIALSFLSAVNNYNIVIVMPENMSIERQKLFKLFGAKVVLTKVELGMKGAIDKAKELEASIPNSFLVSQFTNKANVNIHMKTTAQEIIKDTDGKVDIVIAGVGTGGTITGVGKALKEFNKDIKIIAIEPAGSPVLSGGRPGSHMIHGIGAGFIPELIDKKIIDEIVKVQDEDAFTWAKKLIREEGMLNGISSGAVACATNQYIKKYSLKNKIIVSIFPDTAERYLSLPMFQYES